MANIIDFPTEDIAQRTSGGEPPDMEQRLRHLEEDVAVIKSNYATREAIADLRAEMHKGFGDLRAEMHRLARQQIMWSVGTILTGMALVFAILKWLSP
jgi:transcriptional accessory protein Tex/SPT6